MLAIKTILHPTDFSERSHYAFRLACALARDHGARLIVLHVAETPMPIASAGVVILQPTINLDIPRAQLQRLRPPDPTIPVEHRLTVGTAAAAILEEADKSNCDLIVLGTHGRTGLGRLLMGSVAEQVVRRAPCPVLTVKTPLTDAAPSTQSTPETAGNLAGAAKG
jgi:nucleotide-binding universal stress UspA family protein